VHKTGFKLEKSLALRLAKSFLQCLTKPALNLHRIFENVYKHQATWSKLDTKAPI
jgi:hypothetical protein